MAKYTPEDRPQVRRKSGERLVADLTRPELEKLCGFFGALLTDLKRNWESQPENKGKSVTYSKLWEEYVAATRNAEQAGPGYPPQGVGSPDP